MTETQEIIDWLRSKDGEEWSHHRMNHSDQGGNPQRHSTGAFASIKEDHEGCNYNPRTGDYTECSPTSGFSWTDGIILDELKRYGMNGVPDGRTADDVAA